MTLAQERYNRWTTDLNFDDSTRAELLAIAADSKEIEDRFYMDLEFGTAGLRGVLGAGTNRMNLYTVARASEGFARFLADQGDEVKARGVAISYDSRRFSREFAVLSARIFVSHGIKVFLSDELRPVPMLSYAIRHFGTAGGVMITASHNPAKYNGYKAYGEDGGQLPPEAAQVVADVMTSIEDFPPLLNCLSEDAARATGLWQDIGADLDESYTAMLEKLAINLDAVKRQSKLKIVYTPLHGAGNKPVRRILSRIGFENILVVPEQELPDPNFSTVAFPNPEERTALKMAIELAQKEGADLVIATDPDADRTGVCVRTNAGDYQVLTGNQIGLLLMDYILSAKKKSGTLPDQSFVVTTIVSTKLTKRIADAYGVTLFECLTGFKFIGELIKEKDEFGPMHYQFGFEESFGYLAGTDVRDKDAVVASMLIGEMAASAAEQGQTLYDLMQAIYKRYGFAAEKTISITLEGKEGIAKIKSGMAALREKKADGIPGVDVLAVRDYKLRERIDLKNGQVAPIDLPESDVLLICDNQLNTLRGQVEQYLRSYL
ncbi:MAG: phosphoglucomutase/phosphomannomutase alpha/beta/alpha domain [Firmicutes bacterium]|nr:phosphoglucomutase/phosphomannomutase alpha/beta/alpha domain [Bacillota bacterium]